MKEAPHKTLEPGNCQQSYHQLWSAGFKVPALGFLLMLAKR